jgi:putative endonuclease
MPKKASPMPLLFKGKKKTNLVGREKNGDLLFPVFGEQSYCVYILTCADNTLYTGFTNNLARRLAIHNSGRGAKYTRGRLPVKLSYYELCDGISAVKQREYQIKKLSRKKKLLLIEAGKTATDSVLPL